MGKKPQQPVESIVLRVADIDANTGQMPGIPANPREMAEIDFETLKTSMQRDAEYTKINELIVYPHQGRWVAISGNMRLRAAIALGWETITAKKIPEDTPPALVAKYILLGNASFGKWDFNALVDKWSAVDLEATNITVPSDFEQPSPEDFGDDFSLPEGEQTRERTMTFTLSAEQSDYIDRIIEQAKSAGIPTGECFGNPDDEANIIYAISKQWDEQKKSS